MSFLTDDPVVNEASRRREQILDALAARTPDDLDATEQAMNDLIAADPYDWDAVSALEHIEKRRQL
jgi:hypothetical protein